MNCYGPDEVSCELRRIADELAAPPSGWELLSQALIIGGAFAAAIFAGWGVYQRFRYQERPVWVPTVIRFRPSEIPKDKYDVEFVIANHGDGAALNVELYMTRKGERRAINRQHWAAIAPGESITLPLSFLTAILRDTDRAQKYWSGDATVFDFDGDVLEIEWSQVPRRAKRRRQSFRLDDVQHMMRADTLPAKTQLF